MMGGHPKDRGTYSYNSYSSNNMKMQFADRALPKKENFLTTQEYQLLADAKKTKEDNLPIIKKNIDIENTKALLLPIINKYENDWKASFRSVRLFSDRQLHIDSMKNKINNLSHNNIAKFVSFLEGELEYAVDKHGINYMTAISDICVEFTNSLNTKTTTAIRNVIEAEAVITALNAKLEGKEEPHSVELLSRSLRQFSLK